MKLAEALLLRGDVQKKLASLRDRITNNVVVQEGEAPHEDPNELLREAAGVIEELERLVTAINVANLRHTLPDGRTLTAAIAHRDALLQKSSILNAALAGTQKEPDRYSVREIKWKSVIPVSSLQKQVDDLAKKIRELNAAIQEANWKCELE